MRCVDSSGVCANEWRCGGLDRDVELVARLNNNMLECVPTGQCLSREFAVGDRFSRGWPLDERQPFNKVHGARRPRVPPQSRERATDRRRTFQSRLHLVPQSKGRSSVSAHPRTARGGCRITPSRCCVLQFLARGGEINGVHAAARFPRGRVPRARAGTRRVLSQRRRVAGGRTHRAPPRGPARRGRRLRGERARVRPLGWGQGARCRGVRGNR
jgi:hypothetical protein